ncbi:MAG TPA: 4-diphosphocytidyl-2C-methyl-D-erythritol kinase [Rhodospirillales bacterium]|nr:4-diphosphocytidyl-2C-methyl-D-erythritol kinase [Rhodospirillales bacterium]
MKFGKIPLDQAAGTILAHSTRLTGRIFKKGHILAPEDIVVLQNSGITGVIAARLESEDILEDEAASRISNAIAGLNIQIGKAFTGRCNLIADAHGLINYDKVRLDELNLIDQSITVATLPPYTVVTPRQLIATIKIIPLAVPNNVLNKAEKIAASGAPIISVSPFQKKRVGLIMSRLPGMKESILDNTLKTVSARVATYGSDITHEIRVSHDQEEVKRAIENMSSLCDILLIFGASAVVDRHDVLPAAVESAGGSVDHFGMPVDPGNLLFIGQRGDLPIVGMPGCARSPKLNGFDWVLWRLLANIEVSPQDIMLMGSGGLLKEINERGQLRQNSNGANEKATGGEAKVIALILAAGSSTRMGAKNKLLANVIGKPMITHVVDAIGQSMVNSVVVVTGYEREQIENVLSQRNISFVHNENFKAGLSESLKVGLKEIPDDVDGVLICLGDMPLLTSTIIDNLIKAFDPIEGRSICVPINGRKRGNPVLWDKSYLTEMTEIVGDVGAKKLLEKYSDHVFEVSFEEDNVLIDVDTPDLLKSLNERLLKEG